MNKSVLLPAPIRTLLVLVKNKARHFVRARKLQRLLAAAPNKKIIIGSGGTRFNGWMATERSELDLLKESTWRYFFQENSLDAILAEHVWEHLTYSEAAVAAKNCFKFLKRGGYLRLAVPDGYHPDQLYISDVRPGGNGSGADDHKILYTYDLLANVFTSAGFSVSLLEYFDEGGKFNYKEWDATDGFIERSSRFDDRNKKFPLSYTSIILDAKKVE
jgi:predicted SAM-dependent methyltransferase